MTAAREPAPVLLFAGVARLTHDSFRAAGLVQIALNLAIVFGVFMLTRELAGTRVALMAALLWALYFPTTRSEIGEVTGNLLAATCVTWGFFLFLRAQRKDRGWSWLGAGACLGVAVLSRSGVAIVALVLVLGLLIVALPSLMRTFGPRVMTLPIVHVSISNLRQLLRSLALFVLAFGLTLCPWLVRNYVAFGRPVLGTTLTGYNLYRENSQLPIGSYLHFVAGSEANQAVASLLARRTDLTRRETEAQMDAVYRDEAIRIIKAYPGRYVLASLARAPMLWFDWSVPQAYGAGYGAGGYLIWCQQLLLLLAALRGTGHLRGRAWPLAGGVAAFTLLNMLVIGRLYLLIPVMPLIVALGATGCAATRQKRGSL